MLKKRIIAVLTIYDGIIVQSIGFKKYLPIGKPEIAVEFLNQWGIDEIILLDICATKYNQSPNYELIKKIAKYNRVPLTVGGGIKELDQIKNLMDCGADKISLNHLLNTDSNLITRASDIFGNQCIVISIDGVKDNNKYKVFDYMNNKIKDTTVQSLAESVEKKGAGEILINSVEKDGSKSGYDFNLINTITTAVKIPVISCGGAGSPHHLLQAALETNTSGIAAGNYFHFSEHSVSIAKSIIYASLKIRYDIDFKYEKKMIQDNGRLIKKDETELSKLHYIKHIKEKI